MRLADLSRNNRLGSIARPGRIGISVERDTPFPERRATADSRIGDGLVPTIAFPSYRVGSLTSENLSDADAWRPLRFAAAERDYALKSALSADCPLRPLCTRIRGQPRKERGMGHNTNVATSGCPTRIQPARQGGRGRLARADARTPSWPAAASSYHSGSSWRFAANPPVRARSSRK